MNITPEQAKALKGLNLTEDQIHTLAELAAERVLEKAYLEVGRSVLKKLAWLLGLVVLALMFWLARKGLINAPTI
jgi:hypothetical protein